MASFTLKTSCAFLLAAILAILVPEASGICSPSPCGINTRCSLHPSTGAAVCRCAKGYDHAPGSNTIDGCPIIAGRTGSGFKTSFSGSGFGGSGHRRPSASVGILHNRLGPSRSGGGSSRNRPRQANLGDPCNERPCGQNADCRSAGNRAVCTCLPDHEGDPYRGCQLAPCKQARCAANAECQERGNRAICKCLPGFEGDGYSRCDDNPCNRIPSPCAQNADCTSRGNQAICKCRPNFEGDPFVRCTLDPCLNSPCGINAECTKRGDRAICSCRQGYEGDAYRRCNINPCLDSPCGPNAECEAQGHSARCSCREGYVGDPTSRQGCELDPCSAGVCGENAECTATGRSAICRCPRGYSGDPHSRCALDPCSSEDACGENAICENVSNSYKCKCPPGYEGSPYDRCRLNPCADDPCGPNAECTASGDRAICACNRGYLGSPYDRAGCRSDPCAFAEGVCGRGAECRNENSRPVCFCPSGYVGDPYRQCNRGECESNDECNINQACQNFRCIDPCSSSCGAGADCDVRNHVAICKCAKGFTGDPFQNCRRFTKSEICARCGANTDCEVGPDDTPICRCQRNFVGSPLSGCHHECESDRECSSAQKCENFRCVAVCGQGACGENANCVARNNRPECSCPEDFLGDGYSRCYTECTRHEDCGFDKACVRFQCKDPCYHPREVCGRGADCNPTNHKAVCSCPKGHTGDPFVSCRPFTREDLCNPNPCGANAECQAGTDQFGQDKPVCTCPPGYRGEPLVSCSRGDCDRDSDCPSDKGCYNFRCEDPCRRGACGVNADCRAVNHAAICTCAQGRVGNPLEACRESRRGAQHRVVGINRRRFR